MRDTPCHVNSMHVKCLYSLQCLQYCRHCKDPNETARRDHWRMHTTDPWLFVINRSYGEYLQNISPGREEMINTNNNNNNLFLINEISFELQMETISMLMIFAVTLCYLSSSERKA